MTRRDYRVTDPSGRTIRMSYDAHARLIRREADGAEPVEFAYDAAGRRIGMTDATGTTRYAYDSAGRLTARTDSDGAAFAFGYDPDGRLTVLSYPSGREVRYRYDGDGRLAGLDDGRGAQAEYTLDPAGRLLAERLAGGVTRHYEYENGLLSRFIATGPLPAETAITRDPGGRIRALTEDGRHREFGYDPAGRLIRAGDTEIAYDEGGNRTRYRRGDVETRYQYDGSGQLVATETGGVRTELAYDPAGRLAEQTDNQARRILRYDGFGLPVALTWVGRGGASRVYDGRGLISSLTMTAPNGRAASYRYRWTTSAIPQILCQEHQPGPEDVDGAARFGAEFVYGHGRAFVCWDGGVAPFQRDAFGSTIRTADTDPWAHADRYGEFGEPLFATPRPPGAEPPRFGYRGELQLGPLLYLRSRTYDTLAGRYLSWHPAAAAFRSACAATPYLYACGDPLNRTEPLGTATAPAVWPYALTGADWDVFANASASPLAA